jgi:protein-tyrosine-phosphatase
MFRSKVAEAYFNMLNKNKNYKASGAGPFRGYMPLDKKDVAAARKFGIKIKGRPRGISVDLLRKQDIIVNVANDVPSNLFDVKRGYMKKNVKVISWSVRDTSGSITNNNIEEIVKKIMKKVEKFVKELEKGKW